MIIRKEKPPVSEIVEVIEALNDFNYGRLVSFVDNLYMEQLREDITYHVFGKTPDNPDSPDKS